MTDPEFNEMKSLLHGPAEVPISDQHRHGLRPRVLEAYDAAGPAGAATSEGAAGRFLARLLAAAACVALGAAIGWFARGPAAQPGPAQPTAAITAKTVPPIAIRLASAGDDSGFWSYRRLVRLHSAQLVSPFAPAQLSRRSGSIWDLPVKGIQP